MMKMKILHTLLLICAAAIALAACGTEDCSMCDPAAEYCVVFGSDVAGEPSTFSCRPLPTTCVTATTCACIDDDSDDLEFCFSEGGCSDSDALVTVTCPGG